MSISAATIGAGDDLVLPRDIVYTFATSPMRSPVSSLWCPRPAWRTTTRRWPNMPAGPGDIGKIKQIMADFGLVLHLPPGVI
jgi:hypothetical protein